MTAKAIISAEVPGASALGQRETRGRTYAVFPIIGLGLLLRIYPISLYPLTGDEYNSIAGANTILLNWNSLSYSVMMHFWIRLGHSEFWLRFPSAIFGTAAVLIIFKLGERLGGWRTGVVAGLLAATSPFLIYHSQEMRFYSLFICASAAFMLATVHYVDEKKTVRTLAIACLAGLVLLLSHFLGILALCTQSTATVLVNKSRRVMVSAVAVLLILIGLPLVPGVQHMLWSFYSAHAGVTDSSEPVIARVSIVNFAKAALTGYTFVFGYHVYPLRLVLVIVGSSLCGLLLSFGCARLWKESAWRMLPFIYLLPIVGVFIVLNSIGGRVATVISPRHAAFVWPAFIMLLAIGLTSLKKTAFHMALAGLLMINASSLWLGWQKDWTYGIATDYRKAAEYASRWVTADTAILHDGRSKNPISFYFPKRTTLINSGGYLDGQDLSELLRYQRLVFVTDDWQPERRGGFDRLMERLHDQFVWQDGRVDYPLFEYVLERKTTPEASGYSVSPDTNQVRQPLSIYGLEFQDLALPISIKVKDVPLHIIGAFGLPDSNEQKGAVIPLATPSRATRLVLLTNVVGARGLQSGQQIAEIVVEDKSGKVLKFPLRLGNETDSWDKQCQPPAPCETVFQWHKRMAIVGQNGYEGALRDFQAGLHGVVIDFPEQRDVVKLTIRYLANSGHLYVWGIALPG
jgi:hypothetical protein